MKELDIELKNLSFSYEEEKILEDIELGLMKGNFISIVGPNGSGKSTMLRLISSALKPNKGQVLLLGRDIAEMRKKDIAKAMSFVPQSVPTDIDFTAEEVVLMGRYPHINRFAGETERDYGIVKKAMISTGTLELAGRPMKFLSGGERQRVILAQALAQEPEVLLLDEPVSNLDLQHQIETLSLMKKLCVEEKITVVAILHDLNMATTYSDFVVMLKDQHIEARGIPEEVFTVENIMKVFGIEVSISLSPVSHKPYIYTLKAMRPEPNGKKIHVICGGGSGSKVLSALVQAGYEVTCGVVSAGDMDWKTARDLKMEYVESLPFEGVNEESYQRNLRMAESADIIVVTPVYFGRENRLNGELLRETVFRGKPIYLLDPEEIGARDFTGGEMIKLYETLFSQGATGISEVEFNRTIENKEAILR